MSGPCSQFEELVELYAIGSLDGVERETFERHLLSGCESCRRAVNDAERTLAHLALAAPPATPSPRVRERLMRSVAAPRSRLPLWIAAAAAVIVLVSLAGIWQAWQRAAAQRSVAEAMRDASALDARARSLAADLESAKQREADLVSQLAAARTALAAAGAQVKQLTADLAAANAQVQRMQQEASGLVAREREAESAHRDEIEFVTRPTTRRIEMTTELRKGAPVATAFVDSKSGRAIIRGAAMPPLSTGRVYQLWFVNQADKPVSGGVFTAEAAARGASQLGPPSLKDSVVLAITVEPEGGSPAPTTTPLAYGALAAK
jgi:anti-sigma-K factor RskA